MPQIPFKILALASLVTGALAVPALADTFVGGGFRADLTQQCDPASASITTRVTPVRIGYRPGQSNANTSVLTAAFTDGTQQFTVFQDMVESRQRYRAFGFWAGFETSYNNIPRPRVRAVHLRVIEPAGSTDIATAQSLFVRFEVTNYWRTRGCLATFAGVLTNSTTAAYVDAGDRPEAAPLPANLPAFDLPDEAVVDGSDGAPEL